MILKVVIFGLGRVGGTLASYLLASSLPITELAINDIDKKKELGEYYDLLNFSQLMGKDVLLQHGHLDDADVCIITAGLPRQSGERSFNYQKNLDIVVSCLSKCPHESKVLLVTNPTERIANALKNISKFHDVTVIGEYLDDVRQHLHDDPEEIANIIVDNKGYSSFGCIAEIMLRINSMAKSKQI